MYTKTHTYEIDGFSFALSAHIAWFDTTQRFLDAEEAAMDTRLILSKYKDPLADVSWSIHYGDNHPDLTNKRSRTKMLIEFRKFLRHYLQNGFGYEPVIPKPGIFVVAYPWGSKVDMGPTTQSFNLGKNNRIAFAKSCADFSDPTSDGWLLGRYDSNCVIRKVPLNEY